MFNNFNQVLSASKQLTPKQASTLLRNAMDAVNATVSTAEGVVDKYARQYVMLQELGVNTEGTVVDHTDEARVNAAKIAYNQSASRVRESRNSANSYLEALKQFSTKVEAKLENLFNQGGWYGDYGVGNLNKVSYFTSWRPTAAMQSACDLTVNSKVPSGLYTGVYPDEKARLVSVGFSVLNETGGLLGKIVGKWYIIGNLDAITDIVFCVSIVELFTKELIADSFNYRAYREHMSVYKEHFDAPISYDALKGYKFAVGSVCIRSDAPDAAFMPAPNAAKMLVQLDGGGSGDLGSTVRPIAKVEFGFIPASSTPGAIIHGARPVDGPDTTDGDGARETPIYLSDTDNPVAPVMGQYKAGLASDKAFYAMMRLAVEGVMQYAAEPSSSAQTALDNSKSVAPGTFPEFTTMNFQDASTMLPILFSNYATGIKGAEAGVGGFTLPFGRTSEFDATQKVEELMALGSTTAAEWNALASGDYIEMDGTKSIDVMIPGSSFADAITPVGYDAYLDAIEGATFS